MYAERVTLFCSFSGLANFFHNGVSLRKDAVLASICRVQHILRWFESQQQLNFYASSLLFVYEGLHSSSTLSSSSHITSISSTEGKMAMLSSVSERCHGGEVKTRKVAGRDEELAEHNNNFQVSLPWDHSLPTVFAKLTKGDKGHYTKSNLHCKSKDTHSLKVTVRSVAGDVRSAEDNSPWKHAGELQQPPYRNGNKPRLEGNDRDGKKEHRSWENRKEEEKKLKGQGVGASEWAGGDAGVEVRMIDFAHVFPSESPDHGYIFGLKHLLMVLEQILCEAA